MYFSYSALKKLLFIKVFAKAGITVTESASVLEVYIVSLAKKDKRYVTFFKILFFLSKITAAFYLFIIIFTFPILYYFSIYSSSLSPFLVSLLNQLPYFFIIVLSSSMWVVPLFLISFVICSYLVNKDVARFFGKGQLFALGISVPVVGLIFLAILAKDSSTYNPISVSESSENIKE